MCVPTHSHRPTVNRFSIAFNPELSRPRCQTSPLVATPRTSPCLVILYQIGLILSRLAIWRSWRLGPRPASFTPTRVEMGQLLKASDFQPLSNHRLSHRSFLQRASFHVSNLLLTHSGHTQLPGSLAKDTGKKKTQDNCFSITLLPAGREDEWRK